MHPRAYGSAPKHLSGVVRRAQRLVSCPGVPDEAPEQAKTTMAIEFRPARPEEMREFAYLGAITFGGSTDEREIERRMADGTRRPEDTLCAFEDGAMVARMATLPFTISWHGRTISCGGVSSVGTLPTHRRRGLVRELMTRAFVAMRAHGQPIAMLWASMAAIYQRFGYGICAPIYVGTCDPRTIRFVDEIVVPERVRLVRGEAVLPALAPAYDRFAAERPLMLARDATHWQSFRLRRWNENQPPSLYAVYEEGGQPLGYVIYDVQREERRGPDQKLIVQELAWATPAAHRALLQYLLAHDLAYAVEFRALPLDDPLPVHVQEPRDLGLMLRDGALVRIVDVAAALCGRGYAADGRLTFALTDDLCPWNEDVWTLEVEGGSGRIAPAGGRVAELTLTPRALALLACGTANATRLCRQGLIPPAPAAVLRTADALFATPAAPFCADFF